VGRESLRMGRDDAQSHLWQSAKPLATPWLQGGRCMHGATYGNLQSHSRQRTVLLVPAWLPNAQKHLRKLTKTLATRHLSLAACYLSLACGGKSTSTRSSCGEPGSPPKPCTARSKTMKGRHSEAQGAKEGLIPGIAPQPIMALRL